MNKTLQKNCVEPAISNVDPCSHVESDLAAVESSSRVKIDRLGKGGGGGDFYVL
jgi:hypothetical protein